MKKIIFLIPNLMHGGAEKVLVNLLNNLNKKRYDVTLYSIFDEGVNKQFLLSHINYKYKFKKKFRGNSHLIKLFSPKFLYKWFIKEKYDIVVSYLEGPTTRIVSGCEDSQTKTIAWVHIELKNKKHAIIGFRTYKEAKKNYEKINKIIGVSQNVINNFNHFFSLDNKTEVIYNTNENEQIINKSKENIKIQFPTDNINFISVGKITYTKGYDRLLEAHKELLNKGLKHNIYILGIGEDRRKLEMQIKKLDVNDTFKFLGFDKNPYKYIVKSDVYICSSRREGFSTSVTEALILGLPVISTNCSGAKEMLGKNNEYGIVTENSTQGIYNAMKEILLNPKKIEYYKEKAKVRGGVFSKENTVKMVENLLDNLSNE